jgi:predicted phosphodiesterase
LKQYAVISDVHSNLEALKAVFADIRKKRIEKILFLGDAVGYGPDPDECIALLKKTCHTSIMGNHDWATIDPKPIEYFNEFAKKAILWTRDNISEGGLKYLRSRKPTVSLKKENIFLVHSTPQEPEEWHYLYTIDDVDKNFHYFNEKICFVGHSHIPFIAERSASGEIEIHRENKKIGSGMKYIVNAGSIGQPRDGEPRACYVRVKDNVIEIIRVRYNIEKTQQKMFKADLPTPLIERLSRGM